MLKVENCQVFNLEGALRGLRNPKNSWAKSDSRFGLANLDWGLEELDEVASVYNPVDFEKDPEKWYFLNEEIVNWLDRNGTGTFIGPEDDDGLMEYAFIGKNDLKLAQAMIGAGTDESKFMRQIFVSMDITAPLYWWKEFDTYKVGTVSDSCSTMHKLTSTPITRDSFSFDIESKDSVPEGYDYDEEIDNIIDRCEALRQKYIETKDHFYWRLLVQLLPSGWNQKRTVTLNYQVARAMFFARRFHKLVEWRTLCEFFLRLPYGKEFIAYEKPKVLNRFLMEIADFFGIDTKSGTEAEVISKLHELFDILKKGKELLTKEVKTND